MLVCKYASKTDMRFTFFTVKMFFLFVFCFCLNDLKCNYFNGEFIIYFQRLRGTI